MRRWTIKDVLSIVHRPSSIVYRLFFPLVFPLDSICGYRLVCAVVSKAGLFP